MATRPGGVPRDQAIRSADTSIEEMKPEFVGWADNKVKELIEAIRLIERHPDDGARIDASYRNCRELRDVGATMGFDLVTAVADNLCEILDALKSGAAYHKDAIDCHIDALALSISAPYCNYRRDQLPEMMDGLTRIVRNMSEKVPK
jgi:chemotaxis protein histidine kinase CheA